MDRSHQPSEAHPRHDVLDALKRLVRARPVIQQEQYPCEYLDSEEEQSDSSQEIPIGEFVNRHAFFAERLDQFRPAEAFVLPSANLGNEPHLTRSAGGGLLLPRRARALQNSPGGAVAALKYCARSGRTARCGTRTRFGACRSCIARCSPGACRLQTVRGIRLPGSAATIRGGSQSGKSSRCWA